MESAWNLLALEPTADEGAIRRAYARRLKLTRPDEDPAGFQRLLAARDWAIAQARHDPADAPMAPCAPERPALPADAARGRVVDDEVYAPTDVAPSVVACPRTATVREPFVLPVDQVAADAVPSLVVDVAPLAEGPADWAAAERFALAPPPVAGAPDRAMAWIEAVRRLPRGPRGRAEAALVRAFFAAWHDANGRPSWKRIEATRPTLLAAASVFGWPQEDAAVAASLPPADAAVAAQILRDALSPSSSDRIAPLVSVGFRARLPLQAADARAYFEPHHPAYLAYEACRDRRPPPRRLSRLALAAPHVWALARKRWGIAVLALAGLWLSYGFALFAIEQSITGIATLLACLSVAAWAVTALTVARLADRIAMAGAARAAHRAARKGLFAAAERSAWLRRRGAVMPWTSWVSLICFGWMLFLLPYAVPFLLVGLVLDRSAR